MENNGKYKITIEKRLTTIEVTLKELITNHIHHLDKKMDRITWLLITTLITGIIGLVLSIL